MKSTDVSFSIPFGGRFYTKNENSVFDCYFPDAFNVTLATMPIQALIEADVAFKKQCGLKDKETLFYVIDDDVMSMTMAIMQSQPTAFCEWVQMAGNWNDKNIAMEPGLDLNLIDALLYVEAREFVADRKMVSSEIDGLIEDLATDYGFRLGDGCLPIIVSAYVKSRFYEQRSEFERFQLELNTQAACGVTESEPVSTSI